MTEGHACLSNKRYSLSQDLTRRGKRAFDNSSLHYQRIQEPLAIFVSATHHNILASLKMISSSELHTQLHALFRNRAITSHPPGTFTSMHKRNSFPTEGRLQSLEEANVPPQTSINSTTLGTLVIKEA